MPKIFRVMKADEVDKDKPLVGTVGSCLGVRIPGDIPVDDLGNVQPQTGGMSVSPAVGAAKAVAESCRLRAQFPKAAGNDSTYVWSMGEGAFVENPINGSLDLRPDPDAQDRHGFVEPTRTTTLEEYQFALAETQNDWQKEA